MTFLLIFLSVSIDFAVLLLRARPVDVPLGFEVIELRFAIQDPVKGYSR